MEIPLITEKKYLKGTPKICLDCAELGVDYHSWPVPGYKYCEVCIIGRVLENRKSHLTWWEKFWAEPIWKVSQGFFNQIELRANPVIERSSDIDLLRYETYQLPNGITVQVVHYDCATASYKVRVQNRAKMGVEVTAHGSELRYNHGDLLKTPSVAHAIEKLRERYDAVRISTLGGEEDYWIPVRK